MTYRMVKTVGLDTLVDFINTTSVVSVRPLRVTSDLMTLTLFVPENVVVMDVRYSLNNGFEVVTWDKEDITHTIPMIILEEDLVKGRIPFESLRNGLIRISGKAFTSVEIAILVEKEEGRV